MLVLQYCLGKIGYAVAYYHPMYSHPACQGGPVGAKRSLLEERKLG